MTEERLLAETLARLRTEQEVEIETRARPNAPEHRTIIWVVVDDADRVLIRSYRGASARWYREVLANPACALWAQGDRIEVIAERATDDDRVAACTKGLSAKYAGDPATPAMLREDVLGTTLELRQER